MAAAVSGRTRWSPGNQGRGGTRDLRRALSRYLRFLSRELDAKFLGRFSGWLWFQLNRCLKVGDGFARLELSIKASCLCGLLYSSTWFSA
jgi:hypothetical protein